MAKVKHQKIRIVFEKHDEETAVNVVYGLLSALSGEEIQPGWQVVEPGDPHEIEKLATQDAELLLNDYIANTARGPAAATTYLEHQEKIRRSNLDAIRQVYSNVKIINAEQRNLAIRITQCLEGIKLFSTLVVKGCSLVTGPVGAAIDAGYGIIISQIETWDDASKAKAVAFVNSAGSSSMEAIGEKMAKVAEKRILEGEDFATKVAQLTKRIRKLQHELASHSTSAVRRKLRKALEEQTAYAVDAMKVSKTASTLKVAGKALNFAFVAYEAHEAFEHASIAIDALESDIDYEGGELK